jgi:hypothetical protein
MIRNNAACDLSIGRRSLASGKMDKQYDQSANNMGFKLWHREFA